MLLKDKQNLLKRCHRVEVYLKLTLTDAKRIFVSTRQLLKVIVLHRLGGWFVGISVRRRLAYLLVLFTLFVILPGVLIVHHELSQRRYVLTSATKLLVGPPVVNLDKQLKLDTKTGVFQYNPEAAEGIQSAESSGQTKTITVGGSKYFGTSLAKQAAKGQTYTDAQTKLSFSLIPQFGQMDGRHEAGHVVYPFDKGQVVYTLKDNGLKEDVVLSRPLDNIDLHYQLKLPSGLAARMTPSGGIGIYSADPALFGNISFGDDSGKALVDKAQLNSKKDHLVFLIPAPQIIDSGHGSNQSQVKYVLEGESLIVRANNLGSLKYPISIDPSVVVTSANGFLNGNNEDNNAIITSSAVKRDNLTGGSYSGGWVSTTGFTTGRELFGTASANGYVYILGGWDGFTKDLQDVQYAHINSDGTISSGGWQATTSLPLAMEGFSAVAYNGYLYVAGGLNYASTTYQNSVLYAKLNSDGTIGNWNTTSSFGGVRDTLGFTAYNGYLYVTGGGNASALLSDTQYAQIKADGSIGSWSTTSSLPAGRGGFGMVANNNYLYVVGGHISGSDTTNVYYAKVNVDGTLGVWTSTTNFTTARQLPAVTVHNGYLYVMGGASSGSSISSTTYAPIFADGEIGTWQNASDLPTVREAAGSIAYDGNVYILGGYKSTATPQIYSTVYYATIDPAGTSTPWSSTTGIPITYSSGVGKNKVNYGVYGQTTIAYHYCLFELGGKPTGGASPSPTASVYKSYINANNGTLGTWTATTSLPSGMYYQAGFAYNNRIYLAGGYSTSSGASTNSVIYASVNYADCTLGAWTTNTTTFSGARINLGAVERGGYMYVLGGHLGATEYNDVQYAPIDSSTGVVGTFSTLPSFNKGRDSFYATTLGSYLYVIGGFDGSTYYSDVQFAKFAPTGGLVNNLASCPGGGTLTNSTWCTTTSMGTPRMGMTGMTYAGCIYAVAGGNSGVSLNTSEFACANGSGTLTSWQPGMTISGVRDYAGGAARGGYMYIAGGETGGAAYLDVQYASINNGGSGANTVWNTANSMATARALEGTAVYNGYIYAVGGVDSTGNLTTSVEYTRINDDGSLGAWAPTTGLTISEYAFGMVAHDGYMYKVGGFSSGFHSESEYAQINADGTLGSWTSTTSLPISSAGLGMVQVNGRLYALGGHDASVDHNDVYFTTFKPGGGLNSWQSTTSFNIPRHDLNAVAYNGYIYVMGGSDNSGKFYGDVQYAVVNSDGTLGAWHYASDLPGVREDIGVTAYNGYLYVAGGLDSSFYYDSLWFAPVFSDGSIGSWQEYNLSAAETGAGIQVANGRLYIVGGGSGSGVTTVTYTALQTQPRIAHYSLSVDLASTINGDPGGDPMVTGLSISGSSQGSIGACLSGASGTNATFGPATCFKNVAASGTPVSWESAGRYIFADVVLDDSLSAVFPDSTSTPGSVDGLGLQFHAAPDRRLRGGKTVTDLSSGQKIPGTNIPALQQLDTSGTGPASVGGGNIMQTITTSSCPTTRTRAVDARDNHSYWVQKLADGNCWMLTNLAYAGGGTNTYSDVKALSNGSTDGSTIYTTAKYYVPPGANPTTEPTDPSTSTGGTSQYGYLYNWCAAMGGQTGNGACSSTNATQPNTTINVCPAGWRLPTGGSSSEQNTLNNTINGGSTVSPSGLLSTWLAQYSGNYSSSFLNQGASSFYWSSTVGSTNGAYSLYFTSSNVIPSSVSNKDGGFAVRCLASS